MPKLTSKPMPNHTPQDNRSPVKPAARPQSGDPLQSPATGSRWVTRAVPNPRVSFETFDSRHAKGKVSFHAYIPDAYGREPSRRFPVVYWLHGSGGGLAGIPALARVFDQLIADENVPPFLAILVNGLEDGMYVDWKDGSTPVESVIVHDLIPHVDAKYRTVATRQGRLLDGFSMGGYGAARLGFGHPDLFATVSIMGAGPLDPDFQNTPRGGRAFREDLLKRVYGDREHFRKVSPWTIAETNAAVLRRQSTIRMVAGDRDETFSLNKTFHEHLERLAIPHDWIAQPGVDHNPMRTIAALGKTNADFYRNAFSSFAPTTSPQKSKPAEVVRFDVDGKTRRAIVVNAPAGSEKRPAVLVLHGGMGTADRMRAGSTFDTLAKQEGFLVCYPEGTEFAPGAHAWNTGHLLRRQVRNQDDIAYVDTLIDTLVAKHGADPERIYMTGGSNGGMMTFVYAVARPGRLAAAAPVVAAMFTFDKQPAVPLPILMIQGGKDDEVPVDGGMSKNPLVRRAQDAPYKPGAETVAFWVKANRSSPTPTVIRNGSTTTSTYAAQSGGAITEYVVDSDGGHGWPGSPPRRGGAAPIAAFDGAKRVWQFFRDKRRANPEKAPPPQP